MAEAWSQGMLMRPVGSGQTEHSECSENHLFKLFVLDAAKCQTYGK